MWASNMYAMIIPTEITAKDPVLQVNTSCCGTYHMTQTNVNDYGTKLCKWEICSVWFSANPMHWKLPFHFHLQGNYPGFWILLNFLIYMLEGQYKNTAHAASFLLKTCSLGISYTLLSHGGTHWQGPGQTIFTSLLKSISKPSISMRNLHSIQGKTFKFYSIYMVHNSNSCHMFKISGAWGCYWYMKCYE